MSELPRRYTEDPEVGYATDELREKLKKLWESEPGLFGWLGTVDHKTLGKRYIITSFLFLILGGIEALVIRLQLAAPGQTLLTPEQYNELFSMHGITMIFLYALPVLSGFSIFLFPLLLGTRDMAFPRLNAFSYWVFLFSGLFIYASFLTGEVPNDGWFNYPPYALKQYNPGLNMDFYALGMIFLGISTTTGSINFLITFLRTRAAGMALNRTAVILWGTTTVSAGNLLAVPAVSLAFFLLWMDRQFGTHFYEVSGGGKPLLWQHLFWIFAHPWVYIIVLPAIGIVSDVLPVYCRRPLVGYTLVVLATVTTMILGFGVWVHHMFVTGIPFMSLSVFSGASFIITIPSAVTIFCWIATIWLGRPVLTTGFLYCAALVLMFVIGGVSGVMTASVTADQHLHGTYFVVAHMHYVLIGINVLGVLAGLYFWFPKMTGRMLDERLGKIAFGFVFAGLNLAFLPMHWTGFLGMPRRIYTYPEGAGWGWVNMLTTIGAFVLACGILLVIINLAHGRWFGRQAGPDPWKGPTLEWAISSPPPPYNFAVQPVIASRHPLWEESLAEGTGRSEVDRGPILANGKELLVTSMLDAEPVLVAKVPQDSLWPFLATLAMTFFFAGLLMHWYAMAGTMAAVMLLCAFLWNWPRGILEQVARPHQGPEVPVDYEARKFLSFARVRLGSTDARSNGWWGMACLVITEAGLFSYLLFSYYFMSFHYGREWLPEELPGFKLSGPMTGLLIASSIVVFAGEEAIKKGYRWFCVAALSGGAALALAFVALEAREWSDKKFSLGTDSYSSLFFTVTGFHMAHVIGGVLMLLAAAIWTSLGKFDRNRRGGISIVAFYWHFVDVVWITVFTTFYITPYLFHPAELFS